MNFLGPSWRPKVAAILGIVGPTGLYAVLSLCSVRHEMAEGISGVVFAVCFALGLYNTKQDNVSNSPTPTAVSQMVVPVTQASPFSNPVELAHPVPVVSRPAPDVKPVIKL